MPMNPEGPRYSRTKPHKSPASSSKSKPRKPRTVIPMPKGRTKIPIRAGSGPATRKWLAMSDLEREKLGPKAMAKMDKALVAEYKKANRVKA